MTMHDDELNIMKITSPNETHRKTKPLNPRKVWRLDSRCLIAFLAACAIWGALSPALQAAPPTSHNVVWTPPSLDATGSMPLGNGEVGINLWVEPDGDLRFYISRSDSLSEISRLLKVGAVRIALSPNPFAAGKPFRQELKLNEGTCEIKAGATTLRIFVDAGQPMIHVSGESAERVTVTATVESWRTESRTLLAPQEDNSAWTLRKAPFALVESADIFPAGLKDAVAWYHRNEESPAFTSTIELQSLQSVADKTRDPLLKRTFGGWLTGQGFAVRDRSITTPQPVNAFALRVAAPCAQTPTAQAWLDEAKRIADAPGDASGRTLRWWQQFWQRSWVETEICEEALPESKQPLRVGTDSNGENKFPGQIERTHTEVTRDSFKLEAWIKPESLTPGRIFDNTTAGKRDGFVLNTDPGDSLQMIVGNKVVAAPRGILKVDQWHHVVAEYNGVISIYADDKLVASGSSPGPLPIGRAYTLQRYMQACGGRGTYPIKFNGGIFTVEPKGKPFNADWRAWGESYWFQNIRHMYHPMLASGDFEMMAPFFRLYEDARPICEARAALYHGVEGCYFPETMTVWGAYPNNDYGWDRRGRAPKDVRGIYWRYAWNQGPELVSLLLDYWDYTRDEAFLRDQVLPMAVSVLKYFDTRFKKDADGRIVIDPTQSVETYWYEVINDMPCVAGLNEITTRLCALPSSITKPEQSEFFAKMKAASPIVPVKDGRLVPAQKYKNQRTNYENPELYAVWPFRLYGLGKPGLEEALAAYEHRGKRLDTGWGYDGNCAALLGLADEAASILKIKCANSNRSYRWPVTWGPNWDWLPDQNHGGNLLNTMQLMLLQSDSDKIRLLPAWPKRWPVSFKLHASNNTTVECVYRGGKIEKLEVTPASRAKDVILPPAAESAPVAHP